MPPCGPVLVRLFAESGYPRLRRKEAPPMRYMLAGLLLLATAACTAPSAAEITNASGGEIQRSCTALAEV